VAQQEAFEDALDGLLFVVVQAVDRFELEAQVAGGPGSRSSKSSMWVPLASSVRDRSPTTPASR
jgi:hypothetical protein